MPMPQPPRTTPGLRRRHARLGGEHLFSARAAALRIKTAYAQNGMRPIVVNTIMDQRLSDIVAESGALMLDVFAPFIGPLEAELGAPRSARVGKAHGLTDFTEYEARINATNYALTHDDGIDVNYADADVILVDELCDRALLGEVKPGATIVNVGKRGAEPKSKENAQDRINEELVARAKGGASVVRLKGGDPYLFGRGAEEVEFLAERGIRFEVVPGVPSLLGAGVEACLTKAATCAPFSSANTEQVT